MEKEDLRLIKSKNSKKIHTPGCIAVRMMKKENRVFLQLKDLGGGRLSLVNGVMLNILRRFLLEGD